MAAIDRQHESDSSLPPDADPIDVWDCPRCGLNSWRVLDSYVVGGRLRRRRRCCLNCRKVIHTDEVPVPEGMRVVVVPEEVNA